MTSSPQKNELDLSTVESLQATDDETSIEYSRMTKRVLLKFDLHVLPPLALLWLASFIDRTNVGNARIAGLETDIHLHGNQFNTALAGMYFYILADLPSNWILKKMKPNRWLPFMAAAWGLVTTLSGFVQTPSGLLGYSIYFGFVRGGLLPGIILYLSTIYKRHELQFRVGVFSVSASLSGAFGGLLATAILKMDGVGGIPGWRWIFILEGIATILIGVVAAILLPADIPSAKFLSAEEKAFALRRFRSDIATASEVPLSEVVQEIQREKDGNQEVRQMTFVRPGRQIVNQEEEQFEWGEVIRGCVDIQVWLTGISYLGFIVSLYSYSLFLPTIISGLGFSGGAAQLHTVPPYVPAAVLTVLVAILADRLKWRGPFILICLPLAIAGYVLAIKAETNNGRYAAVFLMAAGVYPSGPCILSILPNNSSGHYKKATAIALQLMIANTGGFIATFAYTADQAPRYIRGHTIVLSFVCLSWVFVAANVLYCIWENKARAEGRRQGNIKKYQELWDAGKTRAPIGDRSPDFRFTL
ncbi:MFS transporter [Phellopilus nigrolimitatus]|nr:MFS transporter [Phellopilus nigrolimitatus]